MSIEQLDARIDLELHHDFISDEECTQLLDVAHSRGFTASSVVTPEGFKAHLDRTSTSCVFVRGETESVKFLERRVQQMFSCDPLSVEGIQVVKYQVGQQFKPHLDTFSDTAEGRKEMLGLGQRWKTILVYLKVPLAGGGTEFPLLGKTVTPIARAAVIWTNCDRKNGMILELSKHAGLPVESGEKIAVNVWIRQPPPNRRC